MVIRPEGTVKPKIFRIDDHLRRERRFIYFPFASSKKARQPRAKRASAALWFMTRPIDGNSIA
jgi:hypothetical protein